MAVDAVLRGPAPVTWPTEDTHHPEQCDPVQLTGAFAPDDATFEIAWEQFATGSPQGAAGRGVPARQVR